MSERLDKIEAILQKMTEKQKANDERHEKFKKEQEERQKQIQKEAEERDKKRQKEAEQRQKESEEREKKRQKEAEQRQKESEERERKKQKESEERERKRQKEAQEREKKYEKARERMDKKLSSYGISMGLQAETFFMEATDGGLELEGIRFEHFANHYTLVDPADVEQKHKGEVDIVLKNGEYFLLLEVKFQVKKKDLSQAIRNAKLLKMNYPKLVENKKILLGFAALGVRAEIRDYFTKKGFYIFTQKNEKLNIYGDGINKTIEGF